MVFMAANQLPNLPDRGSGLSSKMLVLPFSVSFLGREDFELEDKLKDELPGILNWCLKHLQGLRRDANAKDYGSLWPETTEGAVIKSQYRLMSNMFDLFLDTYYTKAGDGGHVLKSEIRTRFMAWARQNNLPPIPKNHVIARLLRETSWDVFEAQRHDNKRVIRRLKPKNRAGSELDD